MEQDVWNNTDETLVALLDAIKAVCGVLAADNQTMADRLTASFDGMAKQYLEKRNPDGVIVMRMLQGHIADRNAVQMLYDAKPQGRG